MSGACVSSGCICCYDGCDCDHCLAGCMGSSDCLCLRSSYCCACNAKSRGCGCTGKKEHGEICKLGCGCCDYGLIYPTKLCASARKFLCLYSAASFPFNKEYVPEPVCASCFIQCCPECGCCKEGPSCPALDMIKEGEIHVPKHENMDR